MSLKIKSCQLNICSDNNVYKFRIPDIPSAKSITGIKIGSPQSLVEEINIVMRNSVIFKTSNFEELETFTNSINVRETVFIEFVFPKQYLFENETFTTTPEIIEEFGDEIIEVYDESDGGYYSGVKVTKKETGNFTREIIKGAQVTIPSFKIKFDF
jgi:hypothetical protein